MQAARLHAFGPSTEIQVTDAPAPDPLAPHDVLVRVVASGVNPIEWKIRSGAMAMALGRPLPITLGWECAGIVEQVGTEVTGFLPGQAVYAYPEFTRDGTHAELVVIHHLQLARKPESLTFEQAAAVPMTAQAAWSLLEAAGEVVGRRVLVHGAAGSVGHWLVQLARQRGAQVLATCSTADMQQVLALGAHEVIDYRTRRFEDFGKVDVVFDLVGGETQTRSWGLLTAGGKLVSIAAPPDRALAEATGAVGSFIFTQPRGAVLTEIALLIDAGRMKPLEVDQVRPLAAVALVHAEAESGGLRGKTVLKVAAA